MVGPAHDSGGGECSQTRERWGDDPQLQVDQLDRLVTLGNARGVVAVGNVDVTIFERATRGEIEAEVRRCIDTVGLRSRFVLSTSCELPPRANPDCVKWFMDAAREYGRYERLFGASGPPRPAQV
jgi:hypothetical protein